jgi:hypothetical protein
MGHDRSGDNLAVYPDGHEYCYRCGYYVPAPLTLAHIKKRTEKMEDYLQNVKDNELVQMPMDYKEVIKDPEAVAWLNACGITPRHCLDYEVGWSDSLKQVVFPVYNDEGKLFATLGRNCSGTGKKWIATGSPHLHPAVYTNFRAELANVLVIVEDVVSAIRVGEIAPCMPLFGTTTTHSRMAWVANHYAKVIVWLDFDAFDKAREVATKLSLYGATEIYMIQTERDPKGYTDAEISELIHGALGISERVSASGVPETSLLDVLCE